MVRATGENRLGPFGGPTVPSHAMTTRSTQPLASQPRPVPHVIALISEAAALLGLSVRPLDSEFGYLIELSDGSTSKTLLGGRSPLNDAVATRVAEDKYYTGLLLQRSGFRVPASLRCLKPGYFVLEDYGDRLGSTASEPFAARHGYPLVVKPNRLSHGRGVQVVRNSRELADAIGAVWTYDYLALVQTAHPGLDIRLDFLDGEFLVGYTRSPDPAWPPTDVQILNLAQGAVATVLESVPQAWTNLGLAIGRCLNLRYFGIDFKAQALETDPAFATVIEVNASPLFVQLYLRGHRELALQAQARVLKAVWSLP
jgi:glutathione synthase/RimK-type ligase-like ATP-grasp enzyme